MIERSLDVDVSLIVPVGRRQSDAAALYAEYKAGIDATGQRYEMIFVLDGPQPKFAPELRELIGQADQVTVVSLTRQFGEATAMMAGFEQASGQVILTLPAYHQIEGSEIGKLLQATESHDVAIGWRSPRAGGLFERLRRGCSTACCAGSPTSITTTWAAARARSTAACSRKSRCTATSIASWRRSRIGRDSR